MVQDRGEPGTSGGPQGATGPERPSLPLQVLRYGSDEPLPARRTVRAGPCTAVLEGSFLRYIRVGEQEVVRGIYATVRDRNWGTIEPHLSAYDVEQDEASFRVRFTAEHRRDEIDFVWHGTIAGTAEGTLTYRFEGTARSTFWRNRIGCCVLHPMELAGTPVEVETAGGPVSGTFPLTVSPHQPFFDVLAIRQPLTSGGELEIRFEGDLFEMEDQRNWTDASYKTYCTPLRLPFPVEVKAGTTIVQAVTLRLTRPVPPGERETLRVAAGRAPARPPTTMMAVSATSRGTLPPLGLGLASHGGPLSATEVERLRRLRLAHLRLVLALGEPHWEATLRRGVEAGAALDAALELEVIAADEAGGGLEALAGVARGLVERGGRIERLLVFPPSGVVTTAPVAARAGAALRDAGLPLRCGGGTRADFVNLNRADLPLDLLDVVGYAVNPQVHAFDNASLVETLAAQAVTVENARRIAAGRPVAVGPVTLRQRLNPAATAPPAEPARGELPPAVDPRQLSLFAAGWTVGSLHRLAAAGAAALTYYETTGRLGVMEVAEGWSYHPRFPSHPGMLFPVYHVLGAAAELAGAKLPDVRISAPQAAEALALRAGTRLRLLVASFLDRPQRIVVDTPPLTGVKVSYLDESTAQRWTADPSALARGSDLPFGCSAPKTSVLDLRPFAVACLDGQLAT
ncbi:MAG TPA: hypothetical protein VHS99_09695 [Chloroflexota bacterium]|nr:hypothetical protein [Chloroflexota bacterium]